MSQQRSWGEATEVDYEFSLLNLYEKGPYRLRITPVGLVKLDVHGKTVDCVEVQYTVLQTDDGQPADYANCVSPLDMLNENLDEVDRGVWYIDKEGTEFGNVRDGTLDLGVPYTFYIPLKRSLQESGLYWITLSDRSDFYDRSGITYWYCVV
jgi:hypothetical protein